VALGALQRQGNKISIDPRATLQMHALLLRLAERGVEIATYRDMAGWIAPLIGTSPAQQESIHRTLSALDGLPQEEEAPVRPTTQALPTPAMPQSGVPKGRSATSGLGRLGNGLIIVLGCVLGIYMLSAFGGDTSIPDPDVPDVTLGDGWIAQLDIWINSLLDRITRSVLLLALFSVGVVIGYFRILRILRERFRREAALQSGANPKGARHELSVVDTATPLFGIARGADIFRRFHLTRQRPSQRVDVRGTVEGARGTAGRVLDISYQMHRSAVGFLFLIDRRSQRDHAAMMAENLAAALQAEGVPCTIADMTADLRAARVGSSTVVALPTLAQAHVGDMRVVISSGAELLDIDLTGPADWLRNLGDPTETIVLLPDANIAASAVLKAAGFSVFGLQDAGVAALARHLQARFTGDPTGERRSSNGTFDRYRGRGFRAGRLVSRQEALRAADQLRSGLSRDAYHLLCVLAIFPILLPELTRYLGTALRGRDERPLYNTAHLAELSALPWFRLGSLPFALRQLLVAELSEAQYDDALGLIRRYQTEGITKDAGGFYVYLDERHDTARVANTLIPDDAAAEIIRDPLVLAFLRKDDLNALTPAAAGTLANLLAKAKDDLWRQRMQFAALATMVTALVLLGAWSVGSLAIAPLLAGFDQLMALVAAIDPWYFREVALMNSLILFVIAVAARLLIAEREALLPEGKVDLRLSDADRRAWPGPFSSLIALITGRRLWVILVVLFCLVLIPLTSPETRSLVWYIGGGPTVVQLGTGTSLGVAGVINGSVIPVMMTLGFVLCRRSPDQIDLQETLAHGRPILLGCGLAIWGLCFALGAVGYNQTTTVMITYLAITTAVLGVMAALCLRSGLPQVFIAAEDGRPPPFRMFLLGAVLAAPLGYGTVELMLQISALTGELNPEGTFALVIGAVLYAIRAISARALIIVLIAAGLSFLVPDVLGLVAIGPFVAVLVAIYPWLFTFLMAILFVGVGTLALSFLPQLADASVPLLGRAVTLWLAAFALPIVAVMIGAHAHRRARGLPVMWKVGSAWAVAFLPVFILLLISTQLTDALFWSGAGLIIPLAAFVTWRFGLWGGAVAAIGSLPIVISTGISANILVGWGSMSVYLTILMIVALVGAPRLFLRILSITHVPISTVWLIGLAGLVEVNYGIPEIAFSATLGLGTSTMLLFFLLGLTRAPLHGPIMVYLALTIVGLIFWASPLSGGFGSSWSIAIGQSNPANLLFGPLVPVLGRIMRDWVWQDVSWKDESSLVRGLYKFCDTLWLFYTVIFLGALQFSFAVDFFDGGGWMTSFVGLWTFFGVFVMGFIATDWRSAQGAIAISFIAWLVGQFTQVVGSGIFFSGQAFNISYSWSQSQLAQLVLLSGLAIMGAVVRRATGQFRTLVLSLEHPEAEALWERPSGNDGLRPVQADYLRQRLDLDRRLAPMSMALEGALLAPWAKAVVEAEAFTGRRDANLTWMVQDLFRMGKQMGDQRDPRTIPRLNKATRLLREGRVPPGWLQMAQPIKPVVWALWTPQVKPFIWAFMALLPLLVFGALSAGWATTDQIQQDSGVGISRSF